MRQVWLCQVYSSGVPEAVAAFYSRVRAERAMEGGHGMIVPANGWEIRIDPEHVWPEDVTEFECKRWDGSWVRFGRVSAVPVIR